MFRFTDYIFTPTDILRIFICALRSFFLGKTVWNIMGATLFIAASWGLHTVLALDFESIFFWLFAFSIVWWRLDSRIPIGLALGCLLAIPIFLELSRRDIVLQGDDWAETTAVWAYFFLVIGVVGQIFEFRTREKAPQTPASLRNVRTYDFTHHGPAAKYATESESNVRSAIRFEMVTVPSKRKPLRGIDSLPRRFPLRIPPKKRV